MKTECFSKKRRAKSYAQGFAVRIVSAACLSGVASQMLLAENSGVLFGAEIGYGGASVQHTDSYRGIFTDPYEKYERSYTSKFDGGGVKYGFIVGYKHFFTPKLGLRAYGNLSLMHSTLTTKEQVSDEWKKVSAITLNYGVNVDFLGNFISLEKLDFGGFVGLGLGANTWIGKSIDDYQKFVASVYQSSWKLNKTGFDVALNVGLRANIAKYHGVELVARVPFIATKILDKSAPDTSAGYQGTYAVKDTLHSPYSIAARYVFSF